MFNTSSNAFLEVQWYLFAASFLIAAGYTLLQGEHVKVDVVSCPCRSGSTCSASVCFLTPMALAVLWYGTPFFLRALASGEMSTRGRPDPLACVHDDSHRLLLLLLQGWSGQSSASLSCGV